MADYDSDSSGDSPDDFQTNVFLGYASQEPTGDEFSQVGGLPVWLDRSSGPSGAYAKCKVCNGTTSLLLQLHGDLPDRFPGHERRLYIFGCRRKACRRKDGCMRALRGVRVTQVDKPGPVIGKGSDTNGAQQEKAAINLGETLFGVKSPSTVSANPFATGSTATAGQMSNPFSSTKVDSAKDDGLSPTADHADVASLPQTFAQKAQLAASESPDIAKTPTEAHQPWPNDPKPYPTYYLDADSEYLDSAASAQEIPANTRLDTSADDAGGDMDTKAAFESSMDKTFQRFADRLAQNPEQVLRYEFGGEPLLYSKSDGVGKLIGASAAARFPRCQRCGAARAFEMQLTPHAITELEAEETGVDGMDWGTVIIAVCSADCHAAPAGEVGYVEEWVGVQWEELTDHAKKK